MMNTSRRVNRKSRRSRKCEICGIREAHLPDAAGIHYAQFPRGVNRCREWLRVVGNEELINLPIEKLCLLKRVCSMHFKAGDFNRSGNRLKRNAVPSVALSLPPLTENQLANFPQKIRRSQGSIAAVAETSENKENFLEVVASGSGVKTPENAASIGNTQKNKAMLAEHNYSKQYKQCALEHEDHQASQQELDQGSTAVLAERSEKIDNSLHVVPSGSGVKSLKNVASASNSQNTQLAVAVLADHNYPKQHKQSALEHEPSQDEIDKSSNKKCLTASKQVTMESRGVKRQLAENEIKVPASKPVHMEGRGVKRQLAENKELTPRKKKLVERLTKTKCTLRSLKKSAILIEKIESPVLRELVINACRNEKRKPKGRRWTTKHKISCLAILKRSPKTYRYLSNAVALPSIKTLQNILKKIPMEPGISHTVLKHLRSIASSKNEKEKICNLAFDEMAIKSRLTYNEANDLVEGFEDLGEFGRSNELADHALVFMLQGLYKKYKQPVAFYFTKGTISSAKLAVIIKNIITEVTACGFTILHTVCDQGPTNMGALKILREGSGPSQDGSNHHFKINEKRIFIVYDIPHLFKSIRNNFLKSGIIDLNGRKGNWEHLVEMENHNRSFLYLNKISQLHVNPTYRSKMRVKLATQMLSNTVSAVLKLMARAETGDKANELQSTAQVIRELDQLFDATNGPSGPQDVKKNIRQNVSEKSVHMEKWTQYINALRNTKFLNRNGVQAKNVKCIEGYIISLKSLRDIWKTVKALGFRYLNLRNLNQDALENLFGIIRQHSPTSRNPTADHFVAALKTSIVTGLTAPHSRGANCEKDNKQLLTDFHNFVFGDDKPNEECVVPLNISQETEEVPQQIGELDEENFPVLNFLDEQEMLEHDFSRLSEQPVVYVAGYVASQILKKINCQSCKNFLTVQNPEDNSIYSLILLREWWQNKFSLTYPSENFCITIKTLVDLTEKDLLPRLHETNVGLLGCTLYSVIIQNVCTCAIHCKDITDMCFRKTSKLLIRRQCQRINEGLASKEEQLASLNKKAEQQGRAK